MKTKIHESILRCGLFGLLLGAACGCNKDEGGDENLKPTDYSTLDNWLAVPLTPTKAVDVFYIYPTVFSSEDRIFAEIDEPSMREGAPGMIEKQASAFETVGNIYAPYYRQCTGGILEFTLEKQNSLTDSLPALDLMAAFDYYIRHYNQGRPFILATHSQGSVITLRSLMAKYMKSHPEVYSRLIAAYLIGYGVTADLLAQYPHLKFAERADDLGVIISYNTEMPGVTETNPVLPAGSVVINPINWKRDATVAPASESLGARLELDNGRFEYRAHYADATVNAARGVVECTTVNPDEMQAPGFPRGAYHTGDYALYYYDLRANAQLRAEAYLDAHP